MRWGRKRPHSMPISIDDNIHIAREHYNRLFDLVDRSKAYDSEGFRQRPACGKRGSAKRASWWARKKPKKFRFE
jgi:hypothetical protein